MQKKITREEKIIALQHDFIERDAKTAVRFSKENRLGWDNGKTPDEGYSQNIIRNPLELIKEAYGQAKDIIACMNIPGRVKVNITGDTNCSTGNRQVFVATKVFDEPSLAPARKMDVFLGCAVHEGCHLLFTDFGMVRNFPHKLMHDIHNIIEDERIERLFGDPKLNPAALPGYIEKFASATKYYYFDLYAQKLSGKEKKGEPLPQFARLINALLKKIRYPNVLTQEEIEEFADPLYDSVQVLSSYEGCYPHRQLEAKEATEKIFDILKSWLEQQKEQERNQQENQGQDQPEETDNSQRDRSSSGNKSGHSDTGEKSGSGQCQDSHSGNLFDDKEMQDNSDGQADAQDQDENRDSDSGDVAQDTGSPVPGKAARRAAAREIDTAAEIISDALDTLTMNSTADPGNMSSSITTKEGKLLARCIQGDVELDGTVCVYKAQNNEFAYRESLSRVKRYVPLIGKRLSLLSDNRSYTLQGCRSGKFDEAKIAEAFQGVPTVYTQMGTIKTSKCAICILIDESGSMYGRNENVARDTAVLLNEAFSKNGNIELFIYGHTAKHSEDSLFVYREPGHNPRHAIGDTSSRDGNRDSKAIEAACKRIRRHTDNDCLFFVITDGAPNEGYEPVRKTVDEYEKKGFHIAAISLEPSYDPELMYRRALRINNTGSVDYGSIAVQIGKLVKGACLKSMKTIVEF